ncbi:hypothetical protein EXN61_22405 [Agrobacterium tumefaciens]|uniref:DUF6471 domain-containing protein n=1 Tax=Agrobacterium tumefaciens TaxID=358 RepID=A0A546XS92_AGRTU|nr:hypothetical protein EXN61_22405 [Agrobacterium tumefaciens]
MGATVIVCRCRTALTLACCRLAARVSIRNKLSRGKFTAAFMSQCLYAVDVQSVSLGWLLPFRHPIHH